MYRFQKEHPRMSQIYHIVYKEISFTIPNESKTLVAAFHTF